MNLGLSLSLHSGGKKRSALPTLTGIAYNGGTPAASDQCDTDGGQPFTLTGTNFLAGAAAAFGGTAATSVVVVNDTTITCVSPAHAVGTVNVTVTTSGGTATLTGGAVYWDPTADATIKGWWNINPTTCGVAVGSAVASVADSSSAGYALPQATPASQPILRQDAGGYYLEFDGDDDFLLKASTSHDAAKTIFCVWDDDGSDDIASVFACDPDYLPNGLMITLPGPNILADWSGSSGPVAGRNASAREVYCVRYATSSTHIYQSSLTPVSIASGHGYATTKVGAGRRGMASRSAKGKWYGGCVFNSDADAATIAKAMRHYSRKNGVTIS
jgi:hypothetical protein